LNVLDWEAIPQAAWRDPDVKEAKQSEFLVERSFPWELIERIGVLDHDVAREVSNAIARTAHRPRVEVVREWYY
jgi:hypothetical protein